MNLKYNTLLAVDDNPAILTAVKICLKGVFENIITLSKPDTILTVLWCLTVCSLIYAIVSLLRLGGLI